MGMREVRGKKCEGASNLTTLLFRPLSGALRQLNALHIFRIGKILELPPLSLSSCSKKNFVYMVLGVWNCSDKGLS